MNTNENSWLKQAKEKLNKQKKKVEGRYEKVIAEPIADALLNFCGQDAEFAQAVAQGGSFQDCLKVVVKDVGTHISDLDAYKRAVAFYFPGAKIEMTMRIDLIGNAAAPKEAPMAEPVEHAHESGEILLSLEDLLL